MRATRRNVLVMLGVLTIAGGALFGTGAFTQVEAQRSVDVSTTGDADAQLALNITNSNLEGSDGATIAFEEDSLNLNATTSYDGALEITNKGDDQINLDIRNGDNSTSLLDETDETMYFEGSSTIASGDTETYDITFDTTGATTTDSVEFPDSVTIVATSQ